MSAETNVDGGGAAPLVLRPAPLGEGADPGGVTAALTEAFAAIRAAVEAGRPVVVVLGAGDLLGQGAPLDAAVATGLLGMVRTFGIEGRKPGWRVNVVAGTPEAGDAVDEAVAMVAASGLTGQLIEVGGTDLGKVPA
jgi:hypothetical protein